MVLIGLFFLCADNSAVDIFEVIKEKEEFEMAPKSAQDKSQR